MKPASIVQFERLYWASFVISVIVSIGTWSQRTAMLAANPVLANAGWFLPLTSVVGFLITLVLWYFIARAPSVIAKWIQVVFAAFAAFSIVSSLFLIATGRVPQVWPAVLGLVGSALYIAAATMLFKPDAKAWFGEGTPGEPLA